MLLPIIMIVVCVLLGGGTLLFLKFSEKRKKAKGRDKEELAQMTANEFVNVKDIRGSFLYTRDGMALAYLKIFPISTELFSKNEKRLISKQLTASLSSGQYPFQLLEQITLHSVNRPVPDFDVKLPFHHLAGEGKSAHLHDLMLQQFLLLYIR